ncbi:hypothetical protein [Kiloniella sp.]
MSENSKKIVTKYPTPLRGELTSDMKQFFDDNGVLVLENFVALLRFVE